MKSNQKSFDSPEFDEFFRRGDEAIHGVDTLQPVAETLHDDVFDGSALRTPAQVERRAKLIKLVSVTMAFLTVGSAGAFTYKAVQGHRPATNLALQVVPTREVSPAVAAPAVPIAAPTQPATVQQLVAIQQPAEPVTANAPEKTALAAAETTAFAANSPAAPEKSEKKPTVANPVVAAKAVSATKPASLAKRAIKLAAASTAPARGMGKSSSAKVTGKKTVGPKPADYHPPTASFSD